MIKTVVTLSRDNMPTWATNFFKHHNDFFPHFFYMKKNARYGEFELIMNYAREVNDLQMLEIANTLYINKKGQVVFYWERIADKTMFMLKWS